MREVLNSENRVEISWIRDALVDRDGRKSAWHEAISRLPYDARPAKTSPPAAHPDTGEPGRDRLRFLREFGRGRCVRRRAGHRWACESSRLPLLTWAIALGAPSRSRKCMRGAQGCRAAEHLPLPA